MQFLWYCARRCLPFALFFLIVQTLLRFALASRINDTGLIAAGDWLRAYAVGTSFDCIVLGVFLSLYVIYLCLLPGAWHATRIDQLLSRTGFVLAAFITLFIAGSEWIFWDEFSVRFNFIAVDYLVYTHEVLANIWESYPVVTIISVEFAIALAMGAIIGPRLADARRKRPGSTMSRITLATIAILMPALLILSRDNTDAEFSPDNELNELAKNGVFSFFAAFRNNELPYDDFFAAGYHGKQPPPIQDVLEEDKQGHRFIVPGSDDIARFIPGRGPELRKNVIFVVMESMSAKYMLHHGWHDTGMTPNLDRLVHESLYFDRAYATGTRTVRGLEALVLSIPPTPGQSIVKRPNNEDLASAGFVFQERGYDTRFLYGGFGYFDNMNYFFAHNGFDIIDRASFSENETTFANAWGLCDEDTYAKSLHEASRSFSAGRPFMHVIMTTSNHRPYTFPEGRPGIPASGGGRRAGVKYADYALGKFLENAAREPWFNDTVFVIVADHTAHAAGKVELSAGKYHIPLLVYAPGFVKPRIFASLTSQIDVMPIVLGLLQFSYTGRFYGEDLLNDDDEISHVYVSNYQKLGYMTADELVILRPDRSIARYVGGHRADPDIADESTILNAIAVYAHASHWRENMARLPSTIGGLTPVSKLSRAAIR